MTPGLSASDRPRTRTATAIYSLVVITTVYCFAFVDRQILNLLVGPIKHDWGVSDLQIGYLIGPAFIFSYMALGLPAGMLVDRFGRRDLILLAGCVWSIATCAAAFVTTFPALIATRVLVGGSEAFLFPAGMSLIADLFRRRSLPVANSVFLMAPYIGGGLALIGGGMVLGITAGTGSVGLPLVGSVRAWQAVFLYIGVAGFIPVLLLLTVPRETAQRARGAAAAPPRYRLADGARHMARRWRFYLFFYLGMSTANLVAQMAAAWAPTLLSRSFSLTPAQVGASYGPLVLVAGIAGGIAGPLLNAWRARHDAQSTMRVACLGPVFILLVFGALHFASGRGAMTAYLALLTFSYSFPLSVAGTAMQVITPSALRGLAASVYLLSNGILGYALGPTLVPLVTSVLLHDPARIGDAMEAIGLICGVLSLALLLLATRGFRLEREAGDPTGVSV